jgi:hypothetical protein
LALADVRVPDRAAEYGNDEQPKSHSSFHACLT